MQYYPSLAKVSEEYCSSKRKAFYLSFFCALCLNLPHHQSTLTVSDLEMKVLFILYSPHVNNFNTQIYFKL